MQAAPVSVREIFGPVLIQPEYSSSSESIPWADPVLRDRNFTGKPAGGGRTTPGLSVLL